MMNKRGTNINNFFCIVTLCDVVWRYKVVTLWCEEIVAFPEVAVAVVDTIAFPVAVGVNVVVTVVNT